MRTLLFILLTLPLFGQDTITIWNTTISYTTEDFHVEMWDDGEVIFGSCDTTFSFKDPAFAEAAQKFFTYVNKKFICVDPLGDYLHASYWYIKANPELRIVVVKWQRLNGEFGPVYYEYSGEDVDLFDPIFDHNLGTYVFTQ
jgi:hypothetical protein